MTKSGMLKVKFDTQKVSDKFQKRDFVLTTDFDGKYPQHVQFQLTQDKCSLIDGLNEGDLITVEFNLKGKEWNSPNNGVKYFNVLEVWKVTKN
jgi:hypothetical protein